MKILFFTPVDLAYGAGVENWLSKVCITLKSTYTISVLHGDVGSPKRWSSAEIEKKYQGVNRIKIHYHNLFSFLFFPSLNSVFTIYRELKRHDTIYFNYIFMGNDLIIILLSILAKKKIVFGFHAPIFFENAVHNFYMKYITFNLIRLISACHVLNKDNEMVLKKYNSHIFRIPAFLLKNEYPKKNLSNFGGKYVFVGRFDFQKGLDLFVLALERVIQRNKKLEFVFFGSGPELEVLNRVKKRFPKNIELNSFETNKAEIYKRRKFLLLTSRFETFPAVVIEAMSYGLPVISTRINGATDIITEYVNGFFISSISEKGISESLLRASLLGKKKYDRMSRNAFQEAKKYTEEQVKKQFIKMFTFRHS